jgi:serine/threonine protein phosphatase PrpC
MRFSVFQVSRQGGRRNNEDRMGYSYTSDSVLLMLADGMGGHPDGEIAAHLALETVGSLFQQMAQPKLNDLADFMEQALMSAHQQILNYATAHAMQDSPRTTLVMAVVQSGQVCWAHCGDSRFYLIRQHQLLTRTQDHSVIERTRRPHGTSGAATTETNRNVLFTCLGSPTRPVFSVAEPLGLRQGDTLMLCSDGLWASLPEKDLVAELSQKPVDIAVPKLVEKALAQAGDHSDNVTCLALNWLTPDTPINLQPGNV